LKIPAAVEDLDAAWLTAALRQGGVLREAAVASFEIGPLADGEGFMGQLLRVRPAYDLEEPDAPASLVVKLSSQTPEMRQRVATRLGYQREVRFYQRLAHRTSLPTPRCYYAEVDGETGLHVLLLQDLAPGRSGSTVAGCSPEQAELAVHEIAHFHAAWWETPELERLEWLTDRDFDPAALREAHDRWWPDFLDQAGHRLPDPVREIGARLGEHRARVMRHLTRTPPRTLVHSDYKLDNLVFGTGEHSAPLVVLDWQLMRRGRGVFDVAFFLSQNLPPGERRAVERDLLTAYHGILLEEGVRGYTFEQCRYDYRMSLLQRFGALISTIAAMPFTQEQIEMHVDVLLPRCCAAILDLDAGELLS
jgi:aminoglycoside phosphotransferase (APT) family kinase protein